MNRRDFVKLAAVAALGALGARGCVLGSPGTVMAFDTRHSAGPQWYRDAYAAGYRLMVLSTNVWGENAPLPEAPTLLGRALDAGLKIAAYTRDPRWYRTGIEACGPHIGALQFFCLDVEIDPGVPVTRAMVDGVRNDASFADVPLWDADHARAGFASYGGWNNRVGAQETEEAVLNGVAINVSSFNADFLT
jgi:hypothetical protein